MNELHKKILDLKGHAHNDFALANALHDLETNTSAFCLMPEWMQEAMKLLFNRGPFAPAIQRRRSDFWIDCTWLSMDAFYEQGADEYTFHLKHGYVFEEDHPEHIADVVEAPIFLEDGGLMFQHPRATFKKGIGQAVSMEGFIAYVYERGASIKVPERTLFDKPRIYCYHRGITHTPTHVRFRAAK